MPDDRDRERGFFADLLHDLMSRIVLVVVLVGLVGGIGTTALVVGYGMTFSGALAVLAICAVGVALFLAVMYFFNG